MILVCRTMLKDYLDNRKANLFIMYLDRCMSVTKRKPITSARGQYIWANFYDLNQALDMLKNRKQTTAVKRHIETTKKLIKELS